MNNFGLIFKICIVWIPVKFIFSHLTLGSYPQKHTMLLWFDSMLKMLFPSDLSAKFPSFCNISWDISVDILWLKNYVCIDCKSDLATILLLLYKIKGIWNIFIIGWFSSLVHACRQCYCDICDHCKFLVYIFISMFFIFTFLTNICYFVFQQICFAIFFCQSSNLWLPLGGEK